MTTPPASAGLLGRLRRWTASDDEIAAEQLREVADEHGCGRLADTPDRAKVRVGGILRSITLQPRAGVPALEAELYDGSDSVTLVWIGRRRIAGIECGRRMTALGRVTEVDGRRVMFNPCYHLLPSATR